jgi:hypothetical protein
VARHPDSLTPITHPDVLLQPSACALLHTLSATTPLFRPPHPQHISYILSPAHILYLIPTTPLTPPVQVLVQLGTLIQQQLVVRVSSEAVLEGMRLRCEAPQDTLKAAAEELKFDLDRYFEDVAGS